jgi:hypothetical protein
LLIFNALALLGVGVWLRCWHLGNIPGCNGDEAWYGVQTWRWLHGGPYFWRTPTGNPCNIFFFSPLAILEQIFSPSITVLRSVAVFSGLAALAINWIMCRWVFDRRMAFVSTIALAILPIDIAYSRFAWDACQSLAATLIVFYLALAFVRFPKQNSLWLLLAFCMAVWVHPTNVFLFMAIAATWLARHLLDSQPSDASGVTIESGMNAADSAKENATKEIAVQGIAASKNAIAENAIAENTIAENTIAENTIAENTIAENAIAENAAKMRRKAWRWGILLFVLLGVACGVSKWLHMPMPKQIDHPFNNVVELLHPTQRPSFTILYARLFTGGTIYRHIAGSQSWFEWPLPEGFDGWGIDVGVFWLALLVSVWLTWRSWEQKRQLVDWTLVVSWFLVLAAFLFITGTRSMMPGDERYALCLIVPTVLLLSRGATLAFDAASPRWRTVLAMGSLGGWLVLADFSEHYFRFMERTGGESHYAFHTAAQEPKEAVLNHVLQQTDGKETWIICSKWWNYWPIHYLALAYPQVHVRFSEPLDTIECCTIPTEGDRWYVEFDDTDDLRQVEASLAGQNTERRLFLDYAGRPFLCVIHAANP